MAAAEPREAALDQNIGRIVERLRRRGVLDNTLILFLSDNGCSGELGLFGMHWHDYKSTNYQTWRTKGGWSVSQGQCWAAYSNTPFRKYKMYVHEGGIATPLIAHWPRGIAEPGRLVTSPFFHIVDIMPTLCDVARTTYPETFQGRRITPTPGRSLVPYFQGRGERTVKRTLYWQHMTQAAIREGDWKLVTLNDRSDSEWELYHLAEDRSETKNLIDEYPEVAERLKAKWRRWAEECHVVPYPESRPKPRQNPPPRPESEAKL